jgi:predicted ArsR family transcriptional regulator
MSAANLTQRFLETTRGQIVALLRRGSQTVEELAQALELTDNAIRSHLVNLERDGLVRQDGVRRGPGAGKPATLYEVPPDAEILFSRAYAPVLNAVLDELAVQLSQQQRDALMHAVGKRLAATVPQTSGDLETRVGAAVTLLNALGGDAQAVIENGTFVIRGCGCPLSTATARRPEVCHAIQALLTEVVGMPVQEECERQPHPRCCFQIVAP